MPSLLLKDIALAPYARQLAEQFNLSITDADNQSIWRLTLTQQGLYLLAPENLLFKPFNIDFNDQGLLRRAQTLTRAEPLMKALGYKEQTPLMIVDATAGLGRDAFLLASKGHQLVLIEKNPLVAALLFDALSRAKISAVGDITARMQLIYGDSALLLASWGTPIDIIYVDPMFPETNKTALVKKEMQILHHCIKPETIPKDFLAQACLKAKRRIVVKRPLQGDYLNHQKPHCQIFSKTYRFDIYTGKAGFSLKS